MASLALPFVATLAVCALAPRPCPCWLQWPCKIGWPPNGPWRWGVAQRRKITKFDWFISFIVGGEVLEESRTEAMEPKWWQPCLEQEATSVNGVCDGGRRRRRRSPKTLPPLPVSPRMQRGAQQDQHQGGQNLHQWRVSTIVECSVTTTRIKWRTRENVSREQGNTCAHNPMPLPSQSTPRKSSDQRNQMHRKKMGRHLPAPDISKKPKMVAEKCSNNMSTHNA